MIQSAPLRPHRRRVNAAGIADAAGRSTTTDMALTTGSPMDLRGVVHGTRNAPAP